MFRVKTLYSDAVRFTNMSMNFVYGYNGNVSYTEYGYSVGHNTTTTLSGNSFYVLNSAGNGQTAMATVNFVTTSANQKVTFTIAASSEANYDFMCLGNLDCDSITKCAAMVSGTATSSHTFTVATAGAHYVKMYYKKDYAGYMNNDKGYYRLTPYTNTTTETEKDTETVRITSRKNWTVTSKPSWVSLNMTSGTRGVSDLVISADVYTGTTSRTGDIVITDAGTKQYILEITQGEAPNEVRLSREAMYETSNAGSDTFTVNLSGNTSWSISNCSGNDSWLKFSPTSGSNGTVVTATWMANNSILKRSCDVTLKGNLGGTDIIKISQEGSYCSCDCNTHCSPYEICPDASYDCTPKEYCTCNSKDTCECDVQSHCDCHSYDGYCDCNTKVTCGCYGYDYCYCDSECDYECSCNTKEPCSCNTEVINNCTCYGYCNSDCNCNNIHVACPCYTQCENDCICNNVHDTCTCDSQCGAHCDCNNLYDSCTCDSQCGAHCDCNNLYDPCVCNTQVTCDCYQNDYDMCTPEMTDSCTCDSQVICEAHCLVYDGPLCDATCYSHSSTDCYSKTTCNYHCSSNECPSHEYCYRHCLSYTDTGYCGCNVQNVCYCETQYNNGWPEYDSCDAACQCHHQTYCGTDDILCQDYHCNCDYEKTCEVYCTCDFEEGCYYVCTADCSNETTCLAVCQHCLIDCNSDNCNIDDCPSYVTCNPDCGEDTCGNDCPSYVTCDPDCSADTCRYDCPSHIMCNPDCKYDTCVLNTCTTEEGCIIDNSTSGSFCQVKCELDNCKYVCSSDTCTIDCDTQYTCLCTDKDNDYCISVCYDDTCNCDCDLAGYCTCDCEANICSPDCNDYACACDCETVCSTDYCYDCVDNTCNCDGYEKPKIGSC